jgi:hypothetical protein
MAEETVEILEWVALLWILALAKASKRSADIRSDLGQASNPERFRGQNQRNPGGREAEGQLAPKAFGAGCVARSLSGSCRTGLRLTRSLPFALLPPRATHSSISTVS